MKKIENGIAGHPLVTILGILFTVLALIVFSLFILQFALVGSPSPKNDQARFTVIPAGTPTLIQPGQVVGAPTATPTSVPVGMMGIGAYVQISGTGGDGLRLRNGAGRDFDPVFLGAENEVFRIVDGPAPADGFIWWYLVAPYDELRKGWAVENYLSVITILTPTPKSN